MYRTVEISALRVGAVLTAPVYDERSQKLLGAGLSLTQAFLEGLRKQ